MRVDFKSSFLSDIKKVKDRTVAAAVRRAIVSVEKAAAPQDIPRLKKLKGFNGGNYYRIKVGSYRIGIAIENETVIFAAFDDRKDIYKYFP